MELQPGDKETDIRAELDRVDSMCALFLAGLEPGPLAVGDLGEFLRRLHRKGEIFEPAELIEIGKLLSVSTRVRHALDSREVEERYPLLHQLGRRFGDFGRIVRRLEEVFDPTGAFLDTASPRLARTRRRLRQSKSDTSAALEKLARQESTRPEETFVTLREGRYLLAVRNQDRGRLPGIVHSHSKTGQTVFLEPLTAVEQNNAISGLEAEEQEECLRILRELCSTVQERVGEITEGYEATAELDLVRAKARFGLDLGCRKPIFNADRLLRLVGARHPLLAAASGGSHGTVVPLDLEMSPEGSTLLVSGPNMGGKTVALKTVGLLCLMAQSGIPIPAEAGTDLPWLDSLFVDLGDEQSIERDTSTFAAHLQNLAVAFREATERSLVLIDELGGGTDPEEGAALGRALIELMTERGTLLLATTHLIGLKIVAHEDPRMRNAAMEFDAETERPTYRLCLGSPGRSRAFELARQILPGGELLERAETYRTRWSAAFDEVLAQLERRRAELDQEVARLRQAQSDLEASREQNESHRERLKERLQLLRETRWETEGRRLAEAERLLGEARRLREQAASIESGPNGTVEAAEVGRLRERVKTLRSGARRPRDRKHLPLDPAEVRPGQSVWSHDLKALVKIDSEPEGTDRVWILHGSIRFRTVLSSLGHPEAGQGAPAPRSRPRRRIVDLDSDRPLEREIDIRGLSAEEGVRETERTVDRAAVSGVPEIRVIHGKGTGTLKREVEAFLRSSPLVESFRTGTPREGGWGATIVRVRSAELGG